jgi:hypothetical protein
MTGESAPPETAAVPRYGQPAGSWPPGRPDDLPMHEALARMRPPRSFTPAPVEPAVLSAVVRAARQAAPLTSCPPLQLLAALDDRPGGSSGVFGTTASGALTAPIAGTSLAAHLRRTYVAAPVLLLICGHVGGGPERYRASLLAASGLGFCLWLAAVRVHLAGRIFWPPSGQVTAALREPDDHGLTRHLCTVALGRPGEQS